jgi:peptide/nickel transport system permease protein
MTHDSGAVDTGLPGRRGFPDFFGSRRLSQEDQPDVSGPARFQRRYPHPAPTGAWRAIRWLVARIARVLLVVWLTSTAVFFAVNIALNPVATMLPIGSTQQTIDAFRQALGLNTPLMLRYFEFLFHILRLNIGPSLWLGTDAFSEAISHIPATLEIAIPASIIGTIVGSAVGILAGRRPDSAFARVVNFLSFALISAAEFWVAAMAILIFAVTLRWLPAGGSIGLSSAVLPIAVLCFRPLAHSAQVMSTSVAEEMQRDYVLTARAKGMSERRSVLRHVARNAALPTLTMAIVDFGAMFGGIAVVVETVFSWPGIGQLASQALQENDVVLIEAIVVVVSFVIASLSLLADLLYLIIDPRVRSVGEPRA